MQLVEIKKNLEFEIDIVRTALVKEHTKIKYL